MNRDTMGVEILFLTWNRLEFTKQALRCLRHNTNWDLVTKLTVFDDSSEDGSGDWANEYCRHIPVTEFQYRKVSYRAPAMTMNAFLAECESPLFVKLDNDIAVPPEWLDIMYDTMGRHPDLELLGMEYGQTYKGPPETGVYKAMPCRHIGGVGMMRTETFFRLPPIGAHGRSGFTEWQHRFKPKRAWVTPDLPVMQLDRLPAEPWCSLSQEYMERKWQRNWGLYASEDTAWTWMETIT